MNNISGAIGTAVSAVVGNPQKALLILHTGKQGGFIPQSVAKSAAAALALPGASSRAGAAAAMNAGVAELAAKTRKMVDLSQNSYHVLEVQYNPSTISIQANAEPVAFQQLQQNIDSGITAQNTRAPSVVLSVELVFDSMNPSDCFPWDTLRSGTLVSTAAHMARNKLDPSATHVSVQTQTNGLLAALMREHTRYITFKWADMTFSGEATEAQAKYTMFSTKGYPVRSTVRLHITQQVQSKEDMQYWENALDRVFLATNDSKVPSALPGNTSAPNAGNLLNIQY